MKIIHPLEPIYDYNSKILILGTMPSVISREKNFYYANPQNRFWLIMATLFTKNLDNNEERKKFLLDNHIALWDVIKSCEITGSSDASIKNIKVNNIKKLIKETKIKYIFCTGKKAYNTLLKYQKLNVPTFYLPSPSSANAAFSLPRLVAEYQIIKDYLEE